MSVPSYLFIGTQRSGTTMMKSILKAHPIIAGRGSIWDPSLIGFEGEPTVFEGMRFTCSPVIEGIAARDDAQVVCSMRHPYDQLYSMIREDIAGGAWVIGWGMGVLSCHSIAGMCSPDLRGFVDGHLKEIVEAVELRDRVRLAALLWALGALRSLLPGVFVMNYDKIVADPQREPQRIFNQIGLGPVPKMADLYERREPTGKWSDLPQYSHVYDTSIGVGAEMLSDEDKHVARQMWGDLPQRTGYELEI